MLLPSSLTRKSAAAVLLFTCLAYLPALSTGCGSDSNPPAQPQAPAPGQTPLAVPAPAPTQVNVNITQIFYNNTLIVAQNNFYGFATVFVINNLTISHSIVADDGTFDSGIILPGEQASFVVTEPGDHSYHCGVHPTDTQERGILHVDAPQPPPGPPSPSPTVTPSETPSPSPIVTPSEHPSPSPTVTPSASPSASPQPTPVPSPPDTLIIIAGASSLTSDAFGASPLSVLQHATVTVVNDDTTPHDVVANDGSFDTGPIAPGASATFVANEAGTIPFHCSIHPDMTGTLIVQAVSEPSPGPSPGPTETSLPPHF